ncbi:hypothetical protein A2291_07315 [candidate division WOR-1 bacterium RIFOXYB2_FULL_42_35]|uniref:Metallo-beta-lactamase domain-containing protein n=1 Tax=candidate division WOR-1 bacterium RIFOXYC2_FULL_41_25 TaxID=1802586 RepID=A0A1F4TMG6_UNCSA|nr:MAG: hypothetical protein A2291_07315 [candidate division WOR-1 bacterium RIFOXYB2_FULL_42_35]OGC25599.1 MAG: hypothetical protein A2247_01575 [candidate division WOR-1 bacterium RIFOXYA2_FULL_41_14]OGC33263.1 MAG: hypothetical protein A2462_07490 [candidate division WOR-1 bacterium RIFOXYC2_FULL_41_25]OGC41375.1 MAG: hypothetical protein A2548_02500 [candidate division WOR-1 bacterium RIFOXYD2_FULL_41_8]
MTVSFLGTNGWYDTDTGNTICVLIETPNEYVVLDAGNGIHKLDQDIKSSSKPIYLFLSHFHLDHVIGLHVLGKFKFKQGMTICIPKGTKKLLKTLTSQPFTLPLARLDFPVKIVEIGKSNKAIKFLEQALLMDHPVPCLGYRFNFQGKVITYVPDTGFCQNAVMLAQDADLLIAECAFKAGQHATCWSHLNPETGAEIAKKAKAKKLVLVHFDAEIYPEFNDRLVAQQQARRIFKNTVTTKDGQIIKI